MAVAKITIEPKSERELADALRNAARLRSPERLPDPGEIVEVTQGGQTAIGICLGYHKGYCEVRGFDDAGELYLNLTFISDEARHGKRECTFRIRDDLRDDAGAEQQ